MPTLTVTVPPGVMLRVRKQALEQKASVVTTQGFDEFGNPTIVKAFGPKVDTWPDQTIDDHVTETRDYEVDANNRIVIEAV